MRKAVFLAVALALVTLAVYWQVGGHDFINLDDSAFIAENATVTGGLRLDSIVRAFSPGAQTGWHPLAILSHMLDVELYGLNPHGHHLTSLLFHVVSTLVLFFLLVRATTALWPSAFVAALFALHPLHVESVAWLAERRDVLSASLGFLALLLYVEYTIRQKPVWYWASLGVFVLGLMAKPMLVTFPFLMLLLDYWPLNRVVCHEDGRPVSGSVRARFREKLPFLAVSLVSVAITINFSTVTDSLGDNAVPLGLRLANAATAPLAYLAKLLWPSGLVIYYPFPTAIPAWQVVCSLFALAVVTAAVVRMARCHPYLPVGWLWFLITLAPVLGIVQFGWHAIADRYTYIPLTGIFIAVAWGITAVTKRLRYERALLALLFSAAVTFSAVATWYQLKHWRNSITLYRHTLQYTSGNGRIHVLLGVALAEQGMIGEAIEEFKKAITLVPEYVEAIYCLGFAYSKQNRFDLAIEEYRRVLEIDQDHTSSINNLGLAYMAFEKYEASIELFNRALVIDQGSLHAHYNLALAYEKTNRYKEALLEYDKALAINPDTMAARQGVDRVLAKLASGAN